MNIGEVKKEVVGVQRRLHSDTQTRKLVVRWQDLHNGLQRAESDIANRRYHLIATGGPLALKLFQSSWVNLTTCERADDDIRRLTEGSRGEPAQELVELVGALALTAGIMHNAQQSIHARVNIMIEDEQYTAIEMSSVVSSSATGVEHAEAFVNYINGADLYFDRYLGSF